MRQAMSWIEATGKRRAAGALLCAWIVTVVVLACNAAIEDGVDLYRRTALGLMLVGVPLAVACLLYGLTLLGKRGRRAFGAVAVLGFAAAIGFQAWDQHRREQASAESRAHWEAVVVAMKAQGPLPDAQGKDAAADPILAEWQAQAARERERKRLD